MTTCFLVLCGILFSTLALVKLRRDDPKRNRVLGKSKPVIKSNYGRAFFLMAVFFPGLCFIVFGNVAALAIWFSGVTLIGWRLAANGAITR